MACGAFTAAAMIARKILMNVALSLGSGVRDSFKSYVDWLAENGHVTPRSKGWVDHIRDKGNEANHEIPQVTKKDAENVIVFLEMLLKTNFEYPDRVPKGN